MSFLKAGLLPLLAFIVPSAVVGQTNKNPNNLINGFTEPYRAIEVSAAEMGIISEIAVSEGESVKAGEVLAKLDDNVLKASLEVAKQSKESKGKLNSAIAEFELQTKRLAKLKGLYERNHASQIEIDRAQSEFKIAKARIEAAQDDLRIKFFEMKRIEAQLEMRRIRSPINGVITHLFKDSGEFVSANDPVVLKVVQLDPLKVIFSVPQQHAKRINAGQTLPMMIGDTKSTATGIVEFVSPTTDAQSGTCSVKIRIDNPDNKWHSGQTCYLRTTAIVENSVSRSKNRAQLTFKNSQHSQSPITAVQPRPR